MILDCFLVLLWKLIDLVSTKLSIVDMRDDNIYGKYPAICVMDYSSRGVQDHPR